MTKGVFQHRAYRVSALALGLVLCAREACSESDFSFGSQSPTPPQQSAQPPVTAPAHRTIQLETKPKPKAAAQNRVNPKRRQGKEGSEEAKLDADQARELFIRRKLRLEQIQSQQQELTKDKKTLAANRARMQARLIETARALRLSEKRLTEIEERLTQMRQKLSEQRANLESKSDQMSSLFVLLQGMSRQPPPVMITHSRDALNMIRSGMVLATFYGDVEKLAAQLSNEVTQLDAAEHDAEAQEQRRKAEQVQNSRLKAQIDLLLIENREQLEAANENIESLNSASKINVAGLKSLEEALPALDAETKKIKDFSAYEASLNEKSAEVSPDAAKLAIAQPGRMKPSIPFANSQGLLPLPAQGRILVKYGQADRDGAASKGVHFETRHGAQVVSPCDGWIEYAGPFRSYGQLLIINPGGSYHVVIAGMDRIQATQGQFVLAGEPVAAMASDVRSGDKATRPTLYVEFRRDQQSIDPAPWWSVGAGKG